MESSHLQALCEFDDVKMSLDNKADQLLILQAENQCLRSKVHELGTEVEETSSSIRDLSNKIATIEGSFTELKDNSKSNFAEHTASHQVFIEQQKKYYEGTTALYEGWTWALGILIALSAVISFVFIAKYKKREIQQVVDSVHEDIKKKIDDDDTIINAVVNSFGKDEVKAQINTIKSDIEANILSRVNLQFTAIREDLRTIDNSSDLSSIITENEDDEH